MVGDVCLVWVERNPRWWNCPRWAPWTIAPETHDVIAMVAPVYFAPIEDEDG